MISYQIHAALAGTLDTARCDASATAVQWLKAAIHAHTPDEAERAAHGISRATARSPHPEATALSLCLEASPRIWTDFDHVTLTLALAGVYCNPSVAPARVQDPLSGAAH